MPSSVATTVVTAAISSDVNSDVRSDSSAKNSSYQRSEKPSNVCSDLAELNENRITIEDRREQERVDEAGDDPQRPRPVEARPALAAPPGGGLRDLDGPLRGDAHASASRRSAEPAPRR